MTGDAPLQRAGDLNEFGDILLPMHHRLEDAETRWITQRPEELGRENNVREVRKDEWSPHRLDQSHLPPPAYKRIRVFAI